MFSDTGHTEFAKTAEQTQNLNVMPADESENNANDEQQSIVIDNGSAYMRVGYCNQDEPYSFKTIVSKESTISDTKMDTFRSDLNKRNDKGIIKMCKSNNLPITGSKHDMINRLIQKYMNENYVTSIGKYNPNKMLHCIHPIEFGEITNWDYIEKIWYHSFYNILNINPSESSVFLTDCITSPNCSRVKTTQLMFEQFNINTMYIGYNGVLSLFASGKLTGMAVDCGYQQTQLIPVHQGFSTQNSCIKIAFGGKHISGYLKKLLLIKHPKYKQYQINWDDVCNMKRNFAYCPIENDDKERSKILCEDGMVISGYLRDLIDVNYSKRTSVDIERLCNKYGEDFIEFVRYRKRWLLPDGNTIEFDDEQFQCTEMIFNPKLIGLNDEKGIHQSIMQQIRLERDKETAQSLLSCVVLCGGSSMFPRLPQRLKNELYKLAMNEDDDTNQGQTIDTNNKRLDINVIRHERGALANWIGGTIVCSLSSLKSMWIDKEEYKEFGASIVHRKCF